MQIIQRKNTSNAVLQEVIIKVNYWQVSIDWSFSKRDLLRKTSFSGNLHDFFQIFVGLLQIPAKVHGQKQVKILSL